jgi:hypothetical protein
MDFVEENGSGQCPAVKGTRIEGMVGGWFQSGLRSSLGGNRLPQIRFLSNEFCCR